MAVNRLKNKNACIAVASACVGAESICQLRDSSSRRNIKQQLSWPAALLSSIEDCSHLPSFEELAQLTSRLPGIKADAFLHARKFGTIPWLLALRELFKEYGHSRPLKDLAATIASTVSQCKPEDVYWRLNRQLENFDALGVITKVGSDRWAFSEAQYHNKAGQAKASHTSAKPDRQQVSSQKHQVVIKHNPEQDAMFHLEHEPGIFRIVLNQSHPLFDHLHAALGVREVQGGPETDLRKQLNNTLDLVHDLVAAWVELEGSEKAGSRLQRLRETRQQWGKIARKISESGDRNYFVISCQ